MNKKSINPRRLITWTRVINGLTISRILIGLPITIALATNNNDIVILLILLGGFTDFLDGYLARKYQYQSALGAKLDPLADKILLLGPLIWLVHENLIPLWAIWLLLSRELFITSWRSNKSTGGPASIQGKYKTILQLTSIILLLWPHNWGTLYLVSSCNKIGYIAFWISLFITYSSAIKYIFSKKESHQK